MNSTSATISCTPETVLYLISHSILSFKAHGCLFHPVERLDYEARLTNRMQASVCEPALKWNMLAGSPGHQVAS